ncbi:hypothetical protein [Allosphingosinicella indica]|uniref:Uncharacterized protein n=1 Tax=Allosphingosinicella indica TaxID=941907 RepID=A0A1X7GW02_9SPHN|nr:hypothetical protein [Allosphingosinicella indica]SMF75593.1 hypothetical protein SAMN06295910_2364 [Allosphingosinicella indica]
MIDRFFAVADRHQRVISFLGITWMVVSWAAYSRFISLPQIELLTGMPAIIASSVFNAVWWGFLNPRIEQRRKMIAGAQPIGNQDG